MIGWVSRPRTKITYVWATWIGSCLHIRLFDGWLRPYLSLHGWLRPYLYHYHGLVNWVAASIPQTKFHMSFGWLHPCLDYMYFTIRDISCTCSCRFFQVVFQFRQFRKAFHPSHSLGLHTLGGICYTVICHCLPPIFLMCHVSKSSMLILDKCSLMLPNDPLFLSYLPHRICGLNKCTEGRS